MSNPPPDITRGLNEFTPERWSRLWHGIDLAEQLEPHLSRLIQGSKQATGSSDIYRRMTRPAFMAAITDNQQVASQPNRYQYSWTEQALTDDDFAAAENPRTGTIADGTYALNLIEGGNSAAGVQGPGVDISGADYPAGFSLKAISNGTLVLIHTVRDAAGDVRYVFSCANAHDGTCT